MSSNVKRALTTACIVGPILAIINQTPLLWQLLQGHSVPLVGLLRISLTFAVPFLVSLYSATMADRKRSPHS